MHWNGYNTHLMEAGNNEKMVNIFVFSWLLKQ